MITPAFGRLTRVDLRSAWRNEASHFTPWLAQPENLALLAATMGLSADSLELQAQEQAVGPFRADILCRNNDDHSLVLIENQLERTDHLHLGQLLTYAAGLKAVTLVWIAERFTEEHRAALDWLNDITDERFHIFGFEIELWRIGDSPPAPKFNVVVQPNEWTRNVQKVSQAGSASTRVGQMQVAYRAAFGEYLREQRSSFKPPSVYPINWASWGLGRGGVTLQAFFNAGQVGVGVEINSREHPTWFSKLAAQRPAIERQTGFALEWDEKPGNKFSAVRCWRSIDMHNEANWPQAHEWLLSRLTAMKTAFVPLVKTLNDEDLGFDEGGHP